MKDLFHPKYRRWLWLTEKAHATGTLKNYCFPMSRKQHVTGDELTKLHFRYLLIGHGSYREKNEGESGTGRTLFGHGSSRSATTADTVSGAHGEGPNCGLRQPLLVARDDNTWLLDSCPIEGDGDGPDNCSLLRPTEVITNCELTEAATTAIQKIAEIGRRGEGCYRQRENIRDLMDAVAELRGVARTTLWCQHFLLFLILYTTGT